MGTIETRLTSWTQIEQSAALWAVNGDRHAHATAVVSASLDREIVGVASSAVGSLHRTRSWLTVDVHPSHRRKGIGTELAKALGDAVGHQTRFAAKALAGSVSLAFLRSLGGHDYQVSPGGKVITTEVEAPAASDVISGVDLPFDLMLEAFVNMYEWTHETWSPIVSRKTALTEFRHDLSENMDQRLSSFQVRDREIIAGCWLFQALAEAPGTVEAVAESTTQTIDGSLESLELCVRGSLARCKDDGIRLVDFDYHRTDPNMAAVMHGLGASGESTHLVELVL